MNLLDFKDKLEKGKNLGGEIVYIKEDNLLYGIQSIYRDNEDKSITLLKSKDNSIKAHDFINILEDIYIKAGDINVFIGEQEYNRSANKIVKNIEFAQYESIKMIFINV